MTNEKINELKRLLADAEQRLSKATMLPVFCADTDAQAYNRRERESALAHLNDCRARLFKAEYDKVSDYIRGQGVKLGTSKAECLRTAIRRGHIIIDDRAGHHE